MCLLILLLSLLDPPEPSFTQADFLLYRDHGLIRLAGRQQVQICDLEPRWSIERPGGHSRVTIEKTRNGVNMFCSIDLPGPDWLFVNLYTADDDSVRLAVTTSWDVYYLRTTQYSSYDQLLASDDDAADVIRGLLLRLGQNPLLPERAAIAAVTLQQPPPDDPAALAACRRLIEQLDDESWETRNAAYQRLRRADLLVHVPRFALDELRPEQQSRVALLLESCNLDGVDPMVIELLGSGTHLGDRYNPLPCLEKKLKRRWEDLLSRSAWPFKPLLRCFGL